jgi:uncharacterized protein YdeI (YjbR/CyaY-like superfamily)
MTDPRVDRYIERAAPFALPVLTHLRGVMHAACPGLHETIKWGMPFFMLGDRILTHMAAFKQHCAFGFWRGREAAERGKGDEAMGQFGRITSIADLPARRELLRIVRQAIAQAEAPPLAPRKSRLAALKPLAAAPPELAAALARDDAARRTFDALAPSQRREYVDWLIDAKREQTRARRLAQAIEWLAEGKPRHWKYQNC